MAAQTQTDGGPIHEAHGQDLLRLFDDLEPGDRVLWGDRKVPCVVARVVDPDDRIGQSLTAGVVRFGPDFNPDDTNLRDGDVLLTPNYWGMTGKKFVLIQGPRGGFYAIVKSEKHGRARPALFRAVRTYHQSKAGHRGHGAFRYEQWFDDTLRVVEHGEPPEVLDEGGDLPSYDEIRDRRVMTYVKEDPDSRHSEGQHYELGTVEDVFDEGLHDAHSRIEAEVRSATEDHEPSPWDDVPAAEDVTRNPRGQTIRGTVTVTNIFQSEYGLKAELETPPPWEIADGVDTPNDVLKSTPWSANHRQWDPDREAWTVDADELTKVAGVLADAGYAVEDEAERGDA